MAEGSRRSLPKYQVFVSSTYKDLREERQAVAWEMLKVGHIPVGMENFSAEDGRGWETICSTIDSSDYYVLILAGLYGTIDPASGLSWTEKEYRYAREKQVPVLAFVRDKKHPIPGDMVETGSSAAKLRALIEDVEAAHLREHWTTREDLAGKVGVALLKTINRDEHRGKSRPGWYRGDQLPGDPAIASELARLSQENGRLRDTLADLERPVARLELEPLSAKLTAAPLPNGAGLRFELRSAFFATPSGMEQMVLPLHRFEVDLCDIERTSILRFASAGLGAPSTLRGTGPESDSLTISSNDSEVYVSGPGRIEAIAAHKGPNVEVPGNVLIRLEVSAAGVPEPFVTYARMEKVASQTEGSVVWKLPNADGSDE